MEKVIAVVVTYNRQALLSECITALRNQTRKPDAILVVNNGSTDNTEQWLQQQDDVTFITQKNVGSSGGFATGLSKACKSGYTWMWCMDDDGYPRADALQNMLEVATDDLKLYNCAVVDKADKKSFVWKTGEFKTIDEVKDNTVEGIGHPFNGTMIHRKIVERVGVPQPKYFLWGDETEYYYRITKKNNIPVCTVTGSIHYHPASAFSYKNDWDYTSSWKMYYYVRNRFYIHRTKFNTKLGALVNYCCFLAAFAGIVLVYQKTNKLKKLSFIMWPATDAFRSNFSATPPIILERLKTKSQLSFNEGVLQSVKNIWAVLFTPSAMVKKMQTR
jgi:rhamnopyranosyl-N-acetylglucosaminyl-diphospho-decaprenol beta-1,3/1,4-galactofuranosyltransferase